MKRKAESEPDPSSPSEEAVQPQQHQLPTLPKTLKLYYFNIKGKGEAIRLLCAYTGLTLDDHRFASRDEFLAMKEGTRLAFGQVPMLEVGYETTSPDTTTDATTTDDAPSSSSSSIEYYTIVQSTAIMRYLGRLTGTYPTSMDEPESIMLAAKIDALMGQENDAFTGMTVLTYPARYGLEKNEKESSFEPYSTTVLPGHLRKMERILATTSETGWLAGTESPTICDFIWACRLDSLQHIKALSTEIQSLTEFPHLKAFVTKFYNLEPIKQYYEKQNV